MSIINFNYSRLKSQRGNAIISGVVGISLIAASALLVINGHLSTLRFKSFTQNKAALTDVKVGILNAFSSVTLYQSSTSLSTALSNGIVVPQAGTMTTYNTQKASNLVQKLANGSTEQTTKAICDQGIQGPVNNNDKAEFIFCFSNSTQSATTFSNSIDSFFGSSGFGLIKVTLKKTSSTQLQFINDVATWGTFLTDPQPALNFQADMTYTFIWGKENEPNFVFEKSGNVLRDLR